MLWSFVCLAFRSVFALVPLLARSRRSKELEILVLRHELAILRRQTRRPHLAPADRALLAALSRALPRPAWTSFPVKPETLLRWHRQLVARRRTPTTRAGGWPVQPGCRFVSPAGAMRGREQVASFLETFAVAFPDARFDVERAIESNGSFALEGVRRGHEQRAAAHAGRQRDPGN